jgi:uncharacterized protein (TIGR02172 family)
LKKGGGCTLLGRKVGEGGNSDVFEWEDNKVIKLAKPNTNLSTLKREYENTLAMWEMGLSVPRAYEIAEFDNRPGIVFEQVHGETQKERLFKSILEQSNEEQPEMPWNDVRLTARLLSEVHRSAHDALRPQRDYLKRQIVSVDYLSKEEKEEAIRMLDSLPIESKICHGDPNPNNILISNGKAVLIDWNDATSGNPETDIAEYILMIRFAVLPPNTPQHIVSFFDATRERIIEVFMDEYTRLTGTIYEDIEPWIVPIAARKLSADAISEDEKQLLVKEIRLRFER